MFNAKEALPGLPLLVIFCPLKGPCLSYNPVAITTGHRLGSRWTTVFPFSVFWRSKAQDPGDTGFDFSKPLLAVFRPLSTDSSQAGGTRTFYSHFAQSTNPLPKTIPGIQIHPQDFVSYYHIMELIISTYRLGEHYI